MEARWYCVSNIGLATLCNSQRDAETVAAECGRDYPKGGPHKAVPLGDVRALTAERDRLAAEVEALRADAERAEPAACLIRSRTYTPAPASHDGQIHYHEWGEWQPATLKHGLAVTDPARNTSPKVWEMLPLYTATPASQP